MGILRGTNKTERHHWWPECASRHWVDPRGQIHVLRPDGTGYSSQPRNIGVITNGHHIKLGHGQGSIWDHNFEPFFSQADSSFPKVIDWLLSLKRYNFSIGTPLAQRFFSNGAPEDEIARLVECLLSLAVRSPKSRESGASVAEQLRGPLPEKERNTIIALNMRHSLETAVAAVGTCGKFVVIYSPEREFVFGDGFYSNLRSPVQPAYRAKLLISITPMVSVLHVQPTHYMEHPKVCTIVVSSQQAEILNNVVQIYAKKEIFFRSEKPEITMEYKLNQHFEFKSQENPIDRLIQSIPGILS